MAEHDRTWARVSEMARAVYPDDLDLAALHAREVFDEEHTAAYACQAEQLHAEAMVAEAEVAAFEQERAVAQPMTAYLSELQAELAASRAELATARAEMARVRV